MGSSERNGSKGSTVGDGDGSGIDTEGVIRAVGLRFVRGWGTAWDGEADLDKLGNLGRLEEWSGEGAIKVSGSAGDASTRKEVGRVGSACRARDCWLNRRLGIRRDVDGMTIERKAWSQVLEDGMRGGSGTGEGVEDWDERWKEREDAEVVRSRVAARRYRGKAVGTKRVKRNMRFSAHRAVRCVRMVRNACAACDREAQRNAIGIQGWATGAEGIRVRSGLVAM